MRSRSFAAAALLAFSVAMPSLPAVSASAAPGAQTAAVQTAPKDKAAKANKAKKAKKAKKVRTKFNLGGTLTEVNVDAKTLTFTVRGGKEKALRGTALTVTLGENARVLRNDAPATLADFVVGDRVRAKGAKVDGAYVAKRVKAESPGFEDDEDAPETPETPETPEI